MTTLPLLQFTAALGALMLAAIVVLFARRATTTSASNVEHAVDAIEAIVDADAAADLLAAEDPSSLDVPFTHLGVDVEPPSAPDWSANKRPAARPPRADSRPLALADVDRATSILRKHIRDEQASIAPWLMLLELYRTHGREQALAELAAEFSERFRARRAGAQAVRGGADGGLEAFPPVMRLVTMLWGTHECRDLLARLARDRSEGRRLGLSRAAYVDIATLAKLLDTLLAELDADRAEDEKVRKAWRTATYVAQPRAA